MIGLDVGLFRALVLLTNLVLLPSVSSAVFVGTDGLSEDNERLMVVSLTDGTQISETLTAFQVENQWYLPVAELSDALGFSIEVSVKLKKAQGNILTEDQPFELDAPNCFYRLRGKQQAFDCSMVIMTEFDLFVRSDLLAQMWPLRLEIDSYASQLEIEPKIKLPIQEKAERQKRPVNQASTILSDRDGKIAETEPDSFLDGFSLDQQLSATYREQDSTELIHSSLLTGEFSGLQFTGFVEGSQERLSSERLSFYRSDPFNQGRLPFSMSEINMLDGVAEGLPLIGGGGLYRGVMLSNQPLNTPMIFDQKDFTGDLAEGWEVELYQNGILIGRQMGEQGRYRFESVPLSYGSNRFLFKFYGPQGEKIEKAETITIGRELIQQGDFHYRLIGGNERQGTRQGDLLQMQGSIGISNRSSAVMAFSRFTNLKQEEFAYSLMGLRSLWQKYFFNLTTASETSGGFATQVSVSRNFGINQVKLNYLHADQFISPEIEYSSTADLTSIISARSTLLLPYSIRTDFEAGQASFSDRDALSFFKNKLSFRTGPLFWFNNIESGGVESEIDGEVSLVARIKRHELRLSSLYSQEGARTYNFGFRSYWSDLLHTNLSYQVDLLSDSSVLSLSASRDFDHLSSSLELGSSKSQGLLANVLVSYNIGREPRASKLFWSGDASALSGMASLLLFIDENANGKRDEAEPVLEGIGVNINGQSQEVRSDHQGMIFLNSLPVHEAMRVEVDLMTLENPNLKPPDEPQFVWLRPGKPAKIDIPVLITSEVTGYLTSKDSNLFQQLRGVPLELLDASDNLVSKTRSESDGFFIFEGIPPGEYKIRIAKEILSDRDLASDVTVQEFKVETDGWLDKELIFRLESSD